MFNRITSQTFEDLEVVDVIVDDILIWGENEQEHDETGKSNAAHQRKEHKTKSREMYIQI